MKNERNDFKTTPAKRMLHNTVYLYIRQIFAMAVSIFTAGVTLRVLGNINYGIYNIVGGFVLVFTFFNEALTSSSQRFLNVSIGEEDLKKTQNVFSDSFFLYVFLIAVIVMTAETVGLWFVTRRLNIPDDRMSAAVICYQLSIINISLQILRVPYSALITAYERMSFYAGVAILEVIFRFVSIYGLLVIPGDKLILFCIINLIITFCINIYQVIYCKKYFPDIKLARPRDLRLIVSMTKFSGWSVVGAVANTSNSQGVNIIVNHFCGVLLNAAVGVANQVMSAVWSFVGNFQMAFKPQILKSYASNELPYFRKLILYTSKISFYLIAFIALPLFLNVDTTVQDNFLSQNPALVDTMEGQDFFEEHPKTIRTNPSARKGRRQSHSKNG